MSYTCTPIEGPEAEKCFYSIFSTKVPFCEFNPGKCNLPEVFDTIAQDVLDFSCRKDDVWLVSYPRTGSTWLQEAVWLIGNDFNFELAKNTLQQLRAPLIEMTTYFNHYEKFLKDVKNSVDLVKRLPTPRFIKSHLPVPLLPKSLDIVKPKLLYVARNPKDMVVSLYHYSKKFLNVETSFEYFAELTLDGKGFLSPILEHYLSFWNKRNEPNVFFLKYEDMKKDFPGTLRRVADFLEKPVNDEQIAAVCEYLSIENMRNNRCVNLSDIQVLEYGRNDKKAFIRKGVVGDWKNHMTPELNARFDKWMEENLKDTGLFFE